MCELSGLCRSLLDPLLHAHTRLPHDEHCKPGLGHGFGMGQYTFPSKGSITCLVEVEV